MGVAAERGWPGLDSKSAMLFSDPERGKPERGGSVINSESVISGKIEALADILVGAPSVEPWFSLWLFWLMLAGDNKDEAEEEEGREKDVGGEAEELSSWSEGSWEMVPNKRSSVEDERLCDRRFLELPLSRSDLPLSERCSLSVLSESDVSLSTGGKSGPEET